MSGFWKFNAKKQTAAGIHQGKWCVYRPDGLRLVVASSRKEAQSLAWALNYAAQAFEKENGGDWRSLLGKGEAL